MERRGTIFKEDMDLVCNGTELSVGEERGTEKARKLGFADLRRKFSLKTDKEAFGIGWALIYLLRRNNPVDSSGRVGSRH